MNLRRCALCQGREFKLVVDLGFHPCADTFVFESQLQEGERTYPLRVYLCTSCGHCQLGHIVPKEVRYQDNDYSYDSSNSLVSITHFTDLARDISRVLNLGPTDIVCDVGSNIGTLLEAFKGVAGCQVVGVDPSTNIAALANARGINTINNFFDLEAVEKILTFGRPSVVTATNVLNHSEDVVAFFIAVEKILDPLGCIVFEMPYLLEMVKRSAFDTIYLEHINYFAITPLSRFLTQRGFGIERIEVSDYMCGTLRIYVRPNAKHESVVEQYIEIEREYNLFTTGVYDAFMERIKGLKLRLNKQLYDIKNSGGKIIGIGAATKGNTLLNYCNIDADLLEYISDTSVLKVGKRTPGSHIPIVADEDIMPDITHGLILPWNIAEHLMSKLSHLGINFIVPMLESKC
jgi:SAM-dependent methyltransferase